MSNQLSMTHFPGFSIHGIILIKTFPNLSSFPTSLSQIYANNFGALVFIGTKRSKESNSFQLGLRVFFFELVFAI